MASNPTAADEAALIATVKAYPFPSPRHSYLFVDGRVLEIVKLGHGAVEDAVIRVDGTPTRAGDWFRRLGLGRVAPMDERTPVLAYGANAAPERLQHKFEAMMPGVVIPVLRTLLYGFDVVYAGHISSYGAIPATLEVSPGAVAEIAITYLDDRQLARMHDTELPTGNYAFGQLDRLRAAPEGLPELESAYSYWSRHGALGAGPGPVALAQLRTTGRTFRAMTKLEVLCHVRDRLAADMDLDTFILENVLDLDIRRTRSRALAASARPFSHPHKAEITG